MAVSNTSALRVIVANLFQDVIIRSTDSLISNELITAIEAIASRRSSHVGEVPEVDMRRSRLLKNSVVSRQIGGLEEDFVRAIFGVIYIEVLEKFSKNLEMVDLLVRFRAW